MAALGALGVSNEVGEFSHRGRDERFADGRATVALATMSVVAAVMAAGILVLLLAWR